MELRFARAARTTKDFDLGLVGNRAERIRKLEQVLKLGFDAFTFRLKPEIHEMEMADTVRVEVAVQYKTRSWQTVEIDLGPGEAHTKQDTASSFKRCFAIRREASRNVAEEVKTPPKSRSSAVPRILGTALPTVIRISERTNRRYFLFQSSKSAAIGFWVTVPWWQNALQRSF
jgi:hypothetical protein